MQTGKSAVTTTAEIVVPADVAQDEVLIKADADMFIGPAGVTASGAGCGYLIKANLPERIKTEQAIYGITASGGANLYYLSEQTLTGRGADI